MGVQWQEETSFALGNGIRFRVPRPHDSNFVLNEENHAQIPCMMLDLGVPRSTRKCLHRNAVQRIAYPVSSARCSELDELSYMLFFPWVKHDVVI